MTLITTATLSEVKSLLLYSNVGLFHYQHIFDFEPQNVLRSNLYIYIPTHSGLPGRGLLESFPTEVWLDTLAVNLTAPFILTRAFFPSMKKKGNHHINIMSIIIPFG